MGLPKSKVVYQGPEGYLVVRVEEGLIWLHAGLTGPKTLSAFKKQAEILANFELELQDRGVARYFTAVKTPKQERYARFMGFQLVDYHIEGTDFQVMIKEI